MKKIAASSLFALVIACLLAPSARAATEPPCDTVCGCSTGCARGCTEGGKVITCGVYGDCHTICIHAPVSGDASFLADATPAASPSWLGEGAAPGASAASDRPAEAQGAQAPAGLLTAPFDQRQNDSGFCTDPNGCVAFCDGVCSPCGGQPVGQCIQNIGRPGCHSICQCNGC